ncbi:MAG: hypothetical protein KBD53_02360 [Candidatus Omnitrophica bacterium]|nr:hypothetical protein [Candidatus Omnitrophota bacterium]
MNTEVKHIWIERLTLAKAAVFFFLYGLDKTAKLFYHSASRSGKIGAKLFPRFTHIILEKGVPDKNNRALLYKVEEDTVKCVEYFFKSLSSEDICIPKNYQDYRQEWMCIHKGNAEKEIRNKISFLYRLDYYYQKKFNAEQKISVWLDDILFKRGLAQITFDCIKEPNLNYWSSWKFFLCVYPWPGLLFLNFACAFISLFRRPQTSINNEKKQITIFEEYISNIYSRFPEAGHLFWYEASGLAAERVILYFDRKDSPISEKAIKNIKEHNMSYITFSNFPIYVKRPFQVFFKVLSQMPAPKILKRENFGLWNYTVYYAFKLEYFRQFFRQHQCRVLHQHQEFGPSTLLKALAIRAEGGIFVWNHWSVDHYPVAYFNYAFADLLLSWGPYNDGYFKAHAIQYKALVQTGMIAGDNILEKDVFFGQEIRKKFSSDVRLIITVLDSTCAPDTPNSISTMIYFYKTIFRMLDQHPTWGIVVKSKGHHIAKLPDPTLFEEIQALEKEKRCVVLEGQTRVSVAAGVGDVSVCYSMNTAGIIAALAGRKTVFWNITSTVEHPLYYLGGKGTFIFESEEQIEQALIDIHNGKLGIGDLSRHLHLFDAFQDSRGRIRSGQLISKIIREMETGKTADMALQNAVREYGKMYGEDKVSGYPAVSNHEVEFLWQKVRERIRQRDITPVVFKKEGILT